MGIEPKMKNKVRARNKQELKNKTEFLCSWTARCAEDMENSASEVVIVALHSGSSLSDGL